MHWYGPAGHNQPQDWRTFRIDVHCVTLSRRGDLTERRRILGISACTTVKMWDETSSATGLHCRCELQTMWETRLFMMNLDSALPSESLQQLAWLPWCAPSTIRRLPIEVH